MGNNDLRNEAKKLLANLSENANALSSEASTFINAFKQEDFFTLKNDAGKVKYYKAAYSKFSLRLVPISQDTLGLTASISALMFAADTAMDEELSAMLKAVFEACENMEREIFSYTDSAEKAMTRDSVALESLMNAAKRLLLTFKSVSELIASIEL